MRGPPRQGRRPPALACCCVGEPSGPRGDPGSPSLPWLAGTWRTTGAARKGLASVGRTPRRRRCAGWAGGCCCGSRQLRSPLVEACDASSWRVRGLDAAQPHALLDLLQDEFPELTAQHIKDHLRQHRMRARTQRQFSKPSPSVTTLRRSEATPPKRPQPEPQPHEGRARRAAQAGTQQAQQAALPQRTTAAAAPQQDWAAPGGEAAAAHHRAELERAAQLSGKLSGLSGHTLGVHSQLSGVVSEALPGDTGALPALQQCRMRAACYLLPAALQALDAAAVRRRRCLEVRRGACPHLLVSWREGLGARCAASESVLAFLARPHVLPPTCDPPCRLPVLSPWLRWWSSWSCVWWTWHLCWSLCDQRRGPGGLAAP